MLFLLGYNFLFNGEGELTLVMGINSWWWGESIVRGNFLGGRGGGGRMSKFLIGVGGLHPIPPVRKFLEIKDENFNVGVH